MPEFIINKREIYIDIKELEEKMKNIEPEECFSKMHSVEINGKVFPLKQPLVAATGLSTLDITMVEAYLIFEKLGYPISFHQ